ncbi:MAG: lipid A biosynthesis lauroyl acyltransferase [Rhodospirillaceae bacterium]|nr:lipid A biosynthesis lauroyl acyltransferase [Rhodospirillaceae bacterium]
MRRRWPWRKRILHGIEAVALYTLFAVLRLVPVDVASAAGGFVARLVGPWLPVSRVGRTNLGHAFPDKSPAEIERILVGVWDNLGRYMAEYPHLTRIWDYDPERPEAARRIIVAGEEHFLALRSSGRPALIFSGHLGNWELMPVGGARLDLPHTVMFRPPNNPHAAALLYRIRSEAMGQLAATGVWGSVAAVQTLMAGRVLGLLIDQHFERGIPVPFFGRPAKTATALAKLARRFDCPVYGARVERLGGVRFRVSLTPPLPLQRTDDAAADVAANTALVTAVLEGWVRERPEQWLWLHRRWR